MNTLKNKNSHITRGNGLLEGFLSRQRCLMANRLISKEKRQGRLLDTGCGTYPLFLLSTEFSNKFGLDRVLTED